MPTYVYGCDTCSHRFEAYQKFQDSPLTACPECGARIRRIMQPTGIHFKGSGWYSTDSRASNTSESSKEKTEASEKSENGVSSKADQTPKADGDTSGKTTKSETDKTPAQAPAKAD